ncbi:hypothetical protein AUJ68_06410 [Candidatus Woesearchaeota archaeon CG1_02_57_44]|nr:MAG: hypothetical protein AUJ68_06410 [Candidatus Woesearchaeota archaeon CG1_02_57_44]
MVASSLDVLIVGTGMMGNLVGPQVRRVGGNVVGVVSRDAERGTAFLDGINEAAPVWTDYETALDESGASVVAVLTPNQYHAEQGILAAQRGKHVFMEKPLATTVADAEAFFSAVTRAGVAAEINSQYRYHETLDGALSGIIVSGELGNPTFIDTAYLQDWQMDPSAAIGWRPIVEIAGKGKLVGDLGAHCLQTMLHLFGGDITDFSGKMFNVFPVRYSLTEAGTFPDGTVPSYAERPDLYTQMDMLSAQYSGDDMATAQGMLRIAAGYDVPFRVALSQVDAGHKNDFTLDVTFERGKVRWSQEHPNQLYIARADGQVTIYERGSAPGIVGTPPGHPQGYGDAIALELLRMHDVIGEGGDAIRAYTQRNIGDAVKVMKVLDAWTSGPLVCVGR